MVARPWRIFCSATLAFFFAIDLCISQPTAPPDLDKSILSQIKEAYKSVYEVPQDLRDELRGYYKNPTPQRENAILKEVRRLYLPTAAQEQAIIFEVRKAYEQWSPQQEARIYRAIEQTEKLPEGAVPPSVQSNQMAKVFAKLDADGDGKLSSSEMPDTLREHLRRFDRNRDGYISPEEFVTYYTARLGWLSEQVSTGQIDLGMKRGGPVVNNIVPFEDEDAKAKVLRAGKLPAGLPDWFVKLDTDKDGQIGLYEWRAAGKSLEDFLILDANDDGFATQRRRVTAKTKRRRSRLRVNEAADARRNTIPMVLVLRSTTLEWCSRS